MGKGFAVPQKKQTWACPCICIFCQCVNPRTWEIRFRFADQDFAVFVCQSAACVCVCKGLPDLALWTWLLEVASACYRLQETLVCSWSRLLSSLPSVMPLTSLQPSLPIAAALTGSSFVFNFHEVFFFFLFACSI